ncbi:amidohydrolase family protein [Conexibacter woesei]|uniref:Amidohydrolase 2 n=1 Tax=Conexibacter woesei (strain DSM 14684 / CCUG 47730 / CIP 108061 / JCM 11494 / NBRC 100937 / ID131577) TaxID=469383 RepID=D3F4B5_CONWI|nr:amidohydrolase family protein [Conexibacter woesei]ADB50487.1 amidohydrolase 2 [Conexibacter woesei DSM 14684]
MSAPAQQQHEQSLVDMAGVVLDEACWEAYLLGFARDVPNYLHVFGERMTAMAGVDRREFRRAVVRDPEAAVGLLIDSGAFALDIDAHVADLERQGVRRQVMLGGMVPLRDGGSFNGRVAEFAQRHPERLEAWAGLDFRDPDAALAELRTCVLERGMRGAGIAHFLDGSDPLAPGSHAVYAEAARLGVPFWIHAGHNLSGTRPVDFCTWRHLDAIARAHPDLVVIAGHGGWPWVLETVAICQRHPNVYLEFSTHRAPHMAVPGSGWEPLLAHGRATIRHKVLFGSVTWAHGLSVRELADEVVALDLGERVTAMWLHDNGARLLDLTRREVTA